MQNYAALSRSIDSPDANIMLARLLLNICLVHLFAFLLNSFNVFFFFFLEISRYSLHTYSYKTRRQRETKKRCANNSRKIRNTHQHSNDVQLRTASSGEINVDNARQKARERYPAGESLLIN